MTRRRGWGRWVVLAALTVVLPATQVWAQHEERSVRAAFVYNLTKYVEWPHAGKELVIGFVGDDGVGETLEKVLAGKSSSERAIRVVISPSDEELQRCDLVYVGYSSKEKIRGVLEKVRNKNILSVGESDHFALDGGMVGLVRVGDEIQIQVNLDEVQAGGLKMSSRLLNLAVIARNRGGQ